MAASDKNSNRIMKKKGFVILIGCTFFIAFSGCYYDKADQVYPQDSNCDTSVVRLSVELNSIMDANCFRCHSSANASINGGNYNLQDYNTIQQAATSGELLSSIMQDGALALPMPQDGGKLSDCDINKFRAWINRGAANN